MGMCERQDGVPGSGYSGGREASTATSQAELFLDLISHDINNMIQIEAGYLELAEQSIDPGSEAYGYIQKCRSVLESNADLLRNVHKLQQVDTGLRTLETVDLGRILGEAVGQYVAAHEKDADIRYLSLCGCYVMANELLKDVFINIIGNAIRHSTGFPVIEVRAGETMQGEQKMCMVIIEDNGPGIPDDMKLRLFSRFQRGQTPNSGKGLGLYLVRKLIDGFRGDVWVEDRVPGDYHQGSRFIILLPAA